MRISQRERSVCLDSAMAALLHVLVDSFPGLQEGISVFVEATFAAPTLLLLASYGISVTLPHEAVPTIS